MRVRAPTTWWLVMWICQGSVPMPPRLGLPASRWEATPGGRATAMPLSTWATAGAAELCKEEQVGDAVPCSAKGSPDRSSAKADSDILASFPKLALALLTATSHPVCCCCFICCCIWVCECWACCRWARASACPSHATACAAACCVRSRAMATLWRSSQCSTTPERATAAAPAAAPAAAARAAPAAADAAARAAC